MSFWVAGDADAEIVAMAGSDETDEVKSAGKSSFHLGKCFLALRRVSSKGKDVSNSTFFCLFFCFFGFRYGGKGEMD